MDTAYKLLMFLLFLFLLISNARAAGSANDTVFIDNDLPGGGQMITIRLEQQRQTS